MQESTERQRTSTGGTVRWSDGGQFGVLPLWVLDEDVSDRAKVLYARLAACAGAENTTLRGHAEMEKWLRCGRTSVRNAVAELVKIGAVTVEETTTKTGGQGHNAYVVHVTPPLRPSEEAPPRESDDLPIGDPKELEETSSLTGGVAVAAVEGVDRPWRRTLVNGRDLPFDALQAEAHIQPRSPRIREIPSALNGGGAGRQPGIRALAWDEAPEWAREDARTWEVWLGEEIHRRAAAYRTAMPGASLTPQALAKWWVDVAVSGQSRGERALQVGLDALGEAS